jgi:hypothetical protein
MKTWFIVLMLYSNPNDDKPALFLMPGSFSAAECLNVKRMFDRDHMAGIGSDADHMADLIAEAKCLKLSGKGTR